jgi:hypothetical protein
MRQTHEQVRCAAIIGERAGVLDLAKRSREGTAVQLRAGKLSAEQKTHVDRAIDAFAEKVAIGLHVDGETPAVVRDAMRSAVKALAEAARG